MPRLLADTFLQQATVQPVVDEVALIVKARVAGQTNALQTWQDTGAVDRSYVDPAGHHVFTNARGTYFNMVSGNQGYVLGTAANQLDIRGGSAGLRILNNAGSVANLAMSDAGVLTLLNLGSIITATPTNQTLFPPSPGAGVYLGYSPIGRFLWHDMLAFSKAGWGTPTFETYTGTWAADTLNTAMFAQLENQAITVIDGTTKTACRWTWNGGNVSWSYSEWWLMAFTYSAVACTKSILIESSVDGVAWTTRHTSANSANAQPVFLYETSHAGDGWVRVTITVTNSQPLLMSSMRAFTTRWGNQGAGSEYAFPYAWDGSQRMAIGAGAVPANAPLTVGTNTTAQSGGLYFGTDTSIWRSAAGILSTQGFATSQLLNANAGLVVDGGGGAFSLKPGAADHVYMQFFADTGSPGTRSGYFGYGSGGTTTLTLANEMSAGAFNIVTAGGGAVQANGSNILRVLDLTTPTIALGTAAAAGSLSSVIRSDATIAAFDATAPSTQAFGDAAVVGSIAFAARRDHKHAMPANPVTAHEAAVDPHTGYVLESLIDAAGDLIVGSAADTVVRLAKGAALDVLRVNSGGTALEWAAPTGGAVHTHDGTGGATSLIIGGTAEAGASIPVAASVGAIAIGDYANVSTATQGISIGTGVNATAAPSSTAQGAIAIGASDGAAQAGARASGICAVAIGGADAAGVGASASGSNAVALGLFAAAAGADAFAGGRGATASVSAAVAVGHSAGASGTSAVAVGRSSTATTTESIAIGQNARAQTGTQVTAIGSGVSTTAAPQASAQGAIAIGASNGAAILGARASGVGAVAIGSGTAAIIGASATGAQSVALGSSAEALAASAVAIGYDAYATQVQTVALGDTATATVASAVAIGYGSIAGHSHALALGADSSTTAANQIMLGNATDQVHFPGTIKIPTSAGTGKVLTSDVNGVAAWAAAAGGKTFSDRAYARATFR